MSEEQRKRRRLLEKARTNNACNHVNNMVKKGVIEKRPCEICGDERSNNHHDDYTQPFEVRWLCVRHHAEWHATHEPQYLPGWEERYQQSLLDNGLSPEKTTETCSPSRESR